MKSKVNGLCGIQMGCQIVQVNVSPIIRCFSCLCFLNPGLNFIIVSTIIDFTVLVHTFIRHL